MSTEPKRQVHLAAHFPGVNNTTVWADPRSGSHIDFESFKTFAQDAERGIFDFMFLAEGLRLREVKGEIVDLDVVGRPDNITMLSAVAAVTKNLGLAGTYSATFNEAYDLARKIATLDHTSAGRSAWNVVTTNDAFTGANFRRGAYLDYADRYRRAESIISAVRTLWESRQGSRTGEFSYQDDFFNISGTFPAAPLPQGHSVIFQAGDSPAGRDFAAGSADVVFTRHSTVEAGTEFVADIKARAQSYGRDPESIKIYPGVTFIIGDTDAEAREISREVAYQQVSGPGAIAFLERTWGRDLSAYDPEGPLPDIEPDLDGPGVSQGRVKHIRNVQDTVAQWRELAEAESLSIRDLVVKVSSSHNFVGTPESIAEQMNTYVQHRAADGFILIPHISPGGLSEFVDRVVPVLQEKGVYRTEYPGTTLRDNIGLPSARPEAEWQAARTAHRTQDTTAETAGAHA